MRRGVRYLPFRSFSKAMEHGWPWFSTFFNILWIRETIAEMCLTHFSQVWPILNIILNLLWWRKRLLQKTILLFHFHFFLSLEQVKWILRITGLQVYEFASWEHNLENVIGRWSGWFGSQGELSEIGQMAPKNWAKKLSKK